MPWKSERLVSEVICADQQHPLAIAWPRTHICPPRLSRPASAAARAVVSYAGSASTDARESYAAAAAGQLAGGPNVMPVTGPIGSKYVRGHSTLGPSANSGQPVSGSGHVLVHIVVGRRCRSPCEQAHSNEGNRSLPAMSPDDMTCRIHCQAARGLGRSRLQPRHLGQTGTSLPASARAASSRSAP
jgi:hypothetical protein